MNLLLRTVYLSCLILLFSILHPFTASSRQANISSSLQTGLDYWLREYEIQSPKTENLDNEKQYWFIKPRISFLSTGNHNSFALEYTPACKYDTVTSSNEIDHSAALNGSLFFTKYWSITANNKFLYSDDSNQSSSSLPESASPENNQTSPQTTDKLAQNQGRKRYWSNKAGLETTYLYAQDSWLTIGYNNHILRYEKEAGELLNRGNDYDKHDIFSSGSYRITQAWKTAFGFHFVKGIYPQEPISTPLENEDLAAETLKLPDRDFEQQLAEAQIIFSPSFKQNWNLNYGYQETRYQDELNQNTIINSLTGTWQYSLSQYTSFFLSGGLVYADIDEQEGKWDYTAACELNKKFHRASIDISLTKKYDTSNFTGSDNYGLIESYQAEIHGSYKFSPDLSLTVYGTYNYQENLTPQGERQTGAELEQQTSDGPTDPSASYNTNMYETGLQMSYAFFPWLKGSLQYSYSKQTGDLAEDSYNDQKFLLQLSWTKNLSHW